MSPFLRGRAKRRGCIFLSKYEQELYFNKTHYLVGYNYGTKTVVICGIIYLSKDDMKPFQLPGFTGF